MAQRIGENGSSERPGNRTKGRIVSGNGVEHVRRIQGRVGKTRHRLGGALIALVQEKPFDAITVQEVLDRAEVGRATFYSHYRDKDDLFLSDIDEFLQWMANVLVQSGERSRRVAPVVEFFAHVKEGRKLYRALQDSGRVHDFLDLARGHFARAIEARLEAGANGENGTNGARGTNAAHAPNRASRPNGATNGAANGAQGHGHGHAAAGGAPRVAASERRAARAQALAGGFLALLVWWLERDTPLSAQDMDDLFHEMVWDGAGKVLS